MVVLLATSALVIIGWTKSNVSNLLPWQVLVKEECGFWSRGLESKEKCIERKKSEREEKLKKGTEEAIESVANGTRTLLETLKTAAETAAEAINEVSGGGSASPHTPPVSSGGSGGKSKELTLCSDWDLYLSQTEALTSNLAALYCKKGDCTKGGEIGVGSMGKKYLKNSPLGVAWNNTLCAGGEVKVLHRTDGGGRFTPGDYIVVCKTVTITQKSCFP